MHSSLTDSGCCLFKTATSLKINSFQLRAAVFVRNMGDSSLSSSVSPSSSISSSISLSPSPASAIGDKLFAVVSDGTNNDIYDVSSGIKSLEDDTPGAKTRFLTYLNRWIYKLV